MRKWPPFPRLFIFGGQTKSWGGCNKRWTHPTPPIWASGQDLHVWWKSKFGKNMSWLSELLFLCTVLTSCTASHTKMFRCFSLTDSFSLSGFWILKLLRSNFSYSPTLCLLGGKQCFHVKKREKVPLGNYPLALVTSLPGKIPDYDRKAQHWIPSQQDSFLLLFEFSSFLQVYHWSYLPSSQALKSCSEW